MIGVLALGRAHESHWLWLVILGGGAVSYLIGRSRSRRTGRPMQRVFWFPDLPWWQQAIFWAVLGSGILYHVVTGHVGWFWWLLAAVAWISFVDAVLRRKPLR